MFRFATPALAGILGALALAPAAFAELNPPAPDFYTCRDTGTQTICHAHRAFREDPYDSEIPCGFTVYDEGDITQVASRYYNADGNLVRRVINETWNNAFWSNPLTGDTVPYTQRGITTEVLAVPGDLSTATGTQTGQTQFTDPVTHKKVMRGAGRVVIAPDGSIESSSGPQWFIQAFYDGDLSVLDGVCAALAR